MNGAGIYKITNKINNKIYIGSATDIKRRWREHKYKLRKGIHPNKHLLSSWNIHGESNFSFEVIEILDDWNKEVLLDKENSYIELLKSNLPEVGYNIRKDCRSQIGYRHSEETKQKMRGRVVSEETRKVLAEYARNQAPYWLGKKRDKETVEKILASRKEKGTKIWNKGIKHSEQDRQKIFGHRKIKFSLEQIEQIKLDYKELGSYRKVADKHHLNRDYVSAIVNDKLILQGDGFYTFW